MGRKRGGRVYASASTVRSTTGWGIRCLPVLLILFGVGLARAQSEPEAPVDVVLDAEDASDSPAPQGAQGAQGETSPKHEPLRETSSSQVALAEGEPTQEKLIAPPGPERAKSTPQPPSHSSRREAPKPQDFDLWSERIANLLEKKLDPELDPQLLFSVTLNDPQAIRLEARRLRVGLVAAGFPLEEEAVVESDDESRPGTSTASPEKPSKSVKADKAETDKVEVKVLPANSPAAEAGDTDEALWQSRLKLDLVSYRFLALSDAERKALLDDHAMRRDVLNKQKAERAPTEAEKKALAAEQERQEALKKAENAKTEAARRVSEEYARLLHVAQLQAEFQTSLTQVKTASESCSEELLTWQRRVKEILTAQPGPAAMGALYAELLDQLQKRRRQFRSNLSELSALGTSIPEPGDDRLKELPPEIDRAEVLAQRSKVLQEASALEQEERKLQRASAAALMNSVQGLNQLRLELLPHIPDEERNSATGLSREGFHQAAAEFQLLSLSVRYRSFAFRQWLDDARHSSKSRKESAWTAVWLLTRWIIPLLIFIWWKRRGVEILEKFRDRLAEERRKYQKRGPDTDRSERIVSFLLRVHSPLEWLALVNATAWILPKDGSELSSASALLISLNWVLGGRLAVGTLDALSSSEIRGMGSLRREQERAQLRMRSLRLVGMAVVVFGLILSLSSDILGEGTLYSWLVFCSWLAGAPILLTVIAWWRPAIFERFELARKKSPFEAWVLANREGTMSFPAAVFGGVYLFCYGIFRTARSWIVTYSFTRRILAYLFRRGMERQAKVSGSEEYGPLPEKQMESLSPERPAPEFISSAADASLQEVIRKIASSGGGIFAIVGERGLGKSTLLSRIQQSVSEVVTMSCPRGGVEAFGQELGQALRHSGSPSIEASAQFVDATLLEGALLVDDAQHLIRPSIGGLSDLDEVLDLARSHSVNCAWVFAFDAVIWRFLERARGSRPLFDDVVVLKPWSEESIVDLLISRNKDAALNPSFEDLLTELPPDADEIDKAEALQKTEASYYRLLWDYASGNPAVALHFWGHSLGLSDKGESRVRLFNAPGTDDLEALPDSAVFVLRAIVQLGTAEIPEICAATSIPERQVRDALRYGAVRGYFDVENGRYRITWTWFRAITRFLYRRHLIFSGAG